jgi:transposase InsO family protein
MQFGQAALAGLSAVGKLIRAFQPQTNGKVERVSRTSFDEWACLQPLHPNDERIAVLADFLHPYNHHRYHTALDGHPPIAA